MFLNLKKIDSNGRFYINTILRNFPSFANFYKSFHRYGCKWFPPEKRHPANGHQLSVIQNDLDKNKKWKDPDLRKTGYTGITSVRGHKLSIEKYDLVGKDVGGRYYRFIARSEYIEPDHRPGCNPILRIQFLKTEKIIEKEVR